MKEGGAHCVKLEGGREMAPQIELLTRGGIPVMAHIGFTPQSEHALGGYRVQGRGDTASRILDDAHAIEEAGAFAVVMEMVPGDVAGQVTKELAIPTIGIGAGPDCDAPGARLAGRLRPAHRQDGEVRQAVRRRARRPPRRRPRLRRRGPGRHVPGSRAHLLTATHRFVCVVERRKWHGSADESRVRRVGRPLLRGELADRELAPCGSRTSAVAGPLVLGRTAAPRPPSRSAVAALSSRSATVKVTCQWASSGPR